MKALYCNSNNNNKKDSHKTNFYGAETLHPTNLHYEIGEKFTKRVKSKILHRWVVTGPQTSNNRNPPVKLPFGTFQHFDDSIAHSVINVHYKIFWLFQQTKKWGWVNPFK